MGRSGYAQVRRPPLACGFMSWEEEAACGVFDPELFFGTTASDERRAKAICGTCAVRSECLAIALSSGMEFGVWGGLNERERRSLRRRNPGVADWRALIDERGLRRLKVRTA